jgi:hypothetical protein
MTQRPTVKITLTPEQQAQVEEATGKSVRAAELNAEALETRAAPGIQFN